MKENEVGRACVMQGRGEKIVQGFGGKSQKKKTSQKTKVKMGSEWILRRLVVSEWIQLAQDRDWWRALVNTEMNLWVLTYSELF
jgi:hypothetical protein